MCALVQGVSRRNAHNAIGSASARGDNGQAVTAVATVRCRAEGQHDETRTRAIKQFAAKAVRARARRPGGHRGRQQRHRYLHHLSAFVQSSSPAARARARSNFSVHCCAYTRTRHRSALLTLSCLTCESVVAARAPNNIIPKRLQRLCCCSGKERRPITN